MFSRGPVPKGVYDEILSLEEELAKATDGESRKAIEQGIAAAKREIEVEFDVD